MGYESEMFAELNNDIKPRLLAIEKHLGINQPKPVVSDTENLLGDDEHLKPVQGMEKTKQSKFQKLWSRLKTIFS